MPKKLYYSIRVLEAKNKAEAISSVQEDSANFIDTHEMSDIIVTKEELIKILTEPAPERCDGCGSETSIDGQGRCLC